MNKKYIKVVVQAATLEDLADQIAQPVYDAYEVVGSIQSYPDPRVGTYFYVALQATEDVPTAPEAPVVDAQ